MRFIETPIFTEELQHLLKDEEYRALQLTLLFRPEQGVLIPGKLFICCLFLQKVSKRISLQRK
jgi:hypothetical protein